MFRLGLRGNVETGKNFRRILSFESSVGQFIGKILEDLKIKNLADYEDLKTGEKSLWQALFPGLQVRYSKKGNRFCIFRLEDQSTGRKMFGVGGGFRKVQEILKDDELLIVEGRIESSEGQEYTIILEECQKTLGCDSLQGKKCADNSAGEFDENCIERIFAVLRQVREIVMFCLIFVWRKK